MADIPQTPEKFSIDDNKLEVLDLNDEPEFISRITSDFVDIQKDDYTWKVNARKRYGWILMALLICQNIFVFGFLVAALMINKLGELQIIFSVIVPATLGETAYMVKVIIQWLFKDINYPK
jgi:hypothetical protein